MAFRTSSSSGVSLYEVLDYLSSRTQVRTNQGHALERARDGMTGGGGSDPEVALAQNMLDLAQVARCVEELERQQSVRFAPTDVLPRFAARTKTRPGALAVAVARVYQPWASDVDAARKAGEPRGDVERGPNRGLAEVYLWMRQQDPSLHLPDGNLPELFRAGKQEGLKKKAGQMVADASTVIGEWVDLWNRKQGFTKHMTVQQFCDKYNLPRSTVLRWCQTGKLDAVKVGGKYGHEHYRIDVSEVRYDPELADSPVEESDAPGTVSRNGV